MFSTPASEESPLLTDQHQHPNSDTRRKTPLPWRQFSILLLLRVSESITTHFMAPFLPQLIRDTGVTGGVDSRVGYYVGIMHSLLCFTEACTAFYWSRLSDRIGRKPVLVMGFFGLSLSLVSFGLSKTYWSLVISQCLTGALNGNVGVMKSIMIEITDSTNIAQAFGMLPITTALGTMIGSLIGGSLYRPAERFPETFGDSKFFKEYPYFLPCIIPAIIVMLSCIVVILFFQETMNYRMSLKQYFLGGAEQENGCNHPPADEILHYDPVTAAENDNQLPFRSLLTRPVLIATGAYATLCLSNLAIRSITPVFYSMPVEMGGLDLDPSVIGTILAFSAVNGLIQWIFFAPMHDGLGAKTTFLASVALFFPVVAMFPAMNMLARAYGSSSSFVWVLVVSQKFFLIFTNFAFEIGNMYVGAAAPNKASIGATNGLSQTVGSLLRSVGPALVNSAFSLSIEYDIMGGYLPYWLIVVMIGLTLRVGCLLPRNMWHE